MVMGGLISKYYRNKLTIPNNIIVKLFIDSIVVLLKNKT